MVLKGKIDLAGNQVADDGLYAGLPAFPQPVQGDARLFFGFANEEAQDDRHGPVELRPEASPGDRAPEVPHVELRERSEEPPLGHDRECTFRSAQNV